MNIAQDKVVLIDYKLTVKGEVVDASEPGEPLTYLHGHGLIIPGLERALEGRAVGDEFQVTVQPEDGYGERNEEAVEELDLADFDDDVEEGVTYYMEGADGTAFPFTIVSIDGDRIRADFNPPLAGQTLDFQVKVVAVRDATPDELGQGFADLDDDEPTGGLMKPTGGLMNITQDKVAEIDYKLTVKGEVIDASEPGKPLTYLHGYGLIIPGLENALEGRVVGDEFQITVQPEDGYGERNEDAVDELDRADFGDDVEEGATYYMEASDGMQFPFTIVSIEGDKVRADFNPPLAGETLNFEVKVLAVRDATPEELEQGFAYVDEEDEA